MEGITIPLIPDVGLDLRTQAPCFKQSSHLSKSALGVFLSDHKPAYFTSYGHFM